MTQALQVARAWAAALGKLEPLPEERLETLLATCSPEDSKPADTGEVLQRALPLATFLDGEQGRAHAARVVPALAALIEALPTVWREPLRAPLQVQADAAQLLASARTLVCTPGALPAALQQQLSAALRTALGALLAAALDEQARAASAPPDLNWTRSGANALLRAVTRSEPFASGTLLPLLHADAAVLLAAAAARVPVPRVSSVSVDALANGGPPTPATAKRASSGGVPAGTRLPPQLRDDKAYLLLSKTVATAATAAALRDGDALTRLLAWSSGAVKAALQRLVHASGSASDDGTGVGADSAGGAPPSLEATYGAADLANACVSQLVGLAKGGSGAGGGGELPREVMAQVQGVVEVALSVAEAAVTVAASTPTDAGNSRVLGMAGRILAGCVSLVAAAARNSPDTGAAVVARLHELMVETARLMAAEDAANAAAIPAIPLRRVLSNRQHARSTRLATGADDAPRAGVFGRSDSGLASADPSVAGGGEGQGAGAAAVAAAAPAGGAHWTPPGFAAELKCPWSWDVTQPLTLLSDGTPLRQVPLSAGMGAQRLLRALIEALSEALASAWEAGARAGVNVLLLPRSATVGWQEQAAEALTLARLYARLGADPALGALVVPLLSDPLIGSLSDAPVNGRARAGPAPEVSGALVNALEGMACACAQNGVGAGADEGGAWSYDQALKLLLKLYREPSTVSRPLLSGKDAAPATRGLLAHALWSLASGLVSAPHSSRQDLRLQLMLLFSAVAGRAAPGGGGSPADLGALLPAVAAGVEGLQPRTLQVLGGSSSRMSIHDIQTAQREDASTTRLFRNLWLHTALHGLVNPTAPHDPILVPSALPADSSATEAWDIEWHEAAGRVAGVTPLLVVGTDSYQEADMVERLKVELGEQLNLAGRLADKGSLVAKLKSLVDGGGAAPPPAPAERELQAFLLAVAASELCRAALARLPDPSAESIVACPVSITLGYLKGVLPEGAASDWVAAISRRAFGLYLARLSALRALQDATAVSAGAATPAAAAAAAMPPALAYAEQLANALIAHLGDGAAAAAAAAAYGGKRRGKKSSMPDLGAIADGMLGELLEAFPALLHSRSCYAALFVQLQREEGDTGLGAAAASRRGAVWERTCSMVRAAASAAPATTEAILHSFLGSGGLPPGGGSTAPVGSTGGSLGAPLRRTGALGGGAAAARAARRSSGAGGGLAGRRAAAEAAAGEAALRRAADLLRICGEARAERAAAGAMAGVEGGAYQGTLALSRKLHYSGFVRGLIGQALAGGKGNGSSDGGAGAGDGDSSASSVFGRQPAALKEVASQLHAGLYLGPSERRAAAGPTPYAASPDDALLCATALLASQPLLASPTAGFGGSLGSIDDLATQSEREIVVSEALRAEGLRLLRALCAAPLRRLTPEGTQLATFSWTWVSTESPTLLVPLVSNLASAWVWTVDQRLGLFSGGPNHRASEDGDEHGADDDEDANDPAVLEAIAAHDIWLAYLSELWTVLRRRGGSAGAAARQQLSRLLHASLQDPSALSRHAASLGARFRLLSLAASFARDALLDGASGPGSEAGPALPPGALLLFDKVLRAALLWFAGPPGYYANHTRAEAREQLASLQAFARLVASFPRGTWPTLPPPDAAAAAAAGRGAVAEHPVWRVMDPDVTGYVRLLQLLLDEEVKRVAAWNEPLADGNAGGPPDKAPWDDLISIAWQVDPALALALRARFPSVDSIARALERLVLCNATLPVVQEQPAAALLLATSRAPERATLLPLLAAWAPGRATLGLQLLSGPAGKEAAVRTYAIKCLFNEKPEKVVFFLPQLVQLLRGDDGAIADFFLASASHSDLFAHQLIWALGSEMRPPEEAFNPEVKRSGWQPPKDTGLWEIAAKVKSQIESGMTPEQREYWAAEGGYFDRVTGLSGYLYKFGKDERRAKLVEALATFKPPRDDLYMPTNPDARILGHIPNSGACMQSAAKVPILVAFNVERPPPGAVGSAAENSVAATHASGNPPPVRVASKLAAIFKVGDDIRQDVLAIQVITLLHGAFTRAGLGLYLRPYGCLPTGYECGIIECVPNTRSRAALGELSDRGLYDIFCAEFGAPGSAAFESARYNFIVSEAAYAVASFLLQAKDRHNGNIMLDDEGHIVHIDFGFILEISPGGNLGFESAAFKLSHEMTQLLDPGGSRQSPHFRLFEELAVRAYIAARTVAEPIIATVALMAESGLPCFGRGAPIANLRRRFHLEMSDAQAAAWMKASINDAYDKWTTGFYDYIQSLQNKIPY